MEDRKDVTVPIPGEWNGLIEDQLEYGDHKSTWIREAIRLRFEAEGIEYPPLEQVEGNSSPRTATVAD